VQQTEAFAGPLPPPRLLDGYEQIVPGAANRIITLAEEEARHRRREERRYGRYRLISLLIAAALAFSILGSGVYLIASGRDAYGLTLLIIEIAGLAAVFLGRQIPRR
jgi:uncharacterized membrane protein